MLYDSTPEEEDSFSMEPVEVGVAFINERLGSSLAADEMQQLLANVEFTVAINNEELVDLPSFLA